MAGDTDPDWPRASAWLAGEQHAAGAAAVVEVLGVPLSVTSISPSQAHTTPAAVRTALRRYSTLAARAGAAGELVDLRALAVADLGDVDLAGLGAAEAVAAVREAVARLAGRAPGAEPALLVLLGGDNALTWPALAGLAGDLSRAGLLTLDAHHDVRGLHAGPRNGTPVRGLVGDGLPGAQVVQIGIGVFTNAPDHRRWCDEHGITVVTAEEARAEGVGACVRRHLQSLAARCDLVYVDLDVDVLDAAFAPGCPGARPGGLTPAELFAAAWQAGAHPQVAAVDIVEVDAAADPHGRTVDAAAQCLLHAAAGVATRPRTPAAPGVRGS